MFKEHHAMSQLSVSNKYKIHNIWSGAQNAVIPYIKLYYEIRAFLKVLKCKCVYQAAIIRSQSIVLGHNYPACQAEHSLQVWRGQDVPPDDALLEAWSVLLHSVKYWIQRNKSLMMKQSGGVKLSTMSIVEFIQRNEVFLLE